MSAPTRPAVPLTGRVSRLASLLPPGLRGRAARLPGTLAPPLEPGTATPRIVIIGAGFGGLGLGLSIIASVVLLPRGLAGVPAQIRTRLMGTANAKGGEHEAV